MRVVKPKLDSIEGVQTAEILGGADFALRAWLDPAKLAAYGLTAADVSQALAAEQLLSGLGTTKGQMVQVDLTAATDLHSLDEFRNLVSSRADGAIVRLKDVANVTLGAEDYEPQVGFDGKQAGVHRHPGRAGRQHARRDRTACATVFPRSRRSCRSGLHGEIVYDATKFVSSSIDEVVKTLVEALLIVDAGDLPVPRLAALGGHPGGRDPAVADRHLLVMLALGFSINLLTLLALVLAIGLVVDDAIIVVENVNRHLKEGMRAVAGRDSAPRASSAGRSSR